MALVCARGPGIAFSASGRKKLPFTIFHQLFLIAAYLQKVSGTMINNDLLFPFHFMTTWTTNPFGFSLPPQLPNFG